MCSAHELWMCQRSGWPHQSISSPAFVWAVLGCKYQKVLSISQEVWGVEGQHPHTQSWESIAAVALVMVRHFQSKIGRAVPVPPGPSSTRTLQKGTSRFWEAEGQQEVPGWGRVCLCSEFSNGETKSYPKAIFISMIVFNKHLCGRQGDTEPHDEPDTAAAREPCWPTQPAQGCCACSAAPLGAQQGWRVTMGM